jgi:hypothetical protein
MHSPDTDVVTPVTTYETRVSGNAARSASTGQIRRPPHVRGLNAVAVAPALSFGITP